MNEAEIKREKKAAKVFRKTALLGGVGMGLFLLSLIAPLIYKSDITGDMQGLFVKYGVYLMAYVGIMVLTFVFVRGKIFLVNGVMQYVVLPTVAILFAMDAYNIITG